MVDFDINVIDGHCVYDKSELARLINNPCTEAILTREIESQKQCEPFVLGQSNVSPGENITTLTDYLELDTWTIEQGACLVAGIDPKSFIGQPKEGDNPVHYPMADSLSGMKLRGHNAVLPQTEIEILNEGYTAFVQRGRVLELWNSQPTPPPKITKCEFVTWCKSKNIDTRWLAEIDAPAAKVKGLPTTSSNGDWKEKARAIADECFDHDTNATPSVRDSLATKNSVGHITGGYCFRVMELMQKRGIKGARGIIDNPATIMREALQGAKWWANKSK